VYPTRPGRLHLLQAAGVLLVLLIAQQQQLITIQGSGRVASAWPDAIHGAWFACVTWIVLSLVGSRYRRSVTLLSTVAIGVAIAVGTELLQAVTGGDAEVGDVCFDMIGMTAAICAWCGHRKLIPRRLGVALAALLMVVSLWPIVPPLLLDRYRDSIAPDLVRFDSPRASELVSSSSVAQIEAAPEGWSITGPVLGITLAAEKWPGGLSSGPDSGLATLFDARGRCVRRGSSADANHDFGAVGPCERRSRLSAVHLRARTVSSAAAVRRSVRPCGGARQRGGDLFRARSSRTHVLPRPRRASRVDCVEPLAGDARWP
jgi:hypothetical protein